MLTDPHVASVGRTWGDQVVTGVHTIAGGRLSTYERPRRPRLRRLAAGTNVRVIEGAVAVGPAAGKWIGQLALAVRARAPIEIRPGMTQPLPSASVIVSALQALAERLQESRRAASRSTTERA